LNTDAIANFYHKFEPNIPNSTINWRIYSLVQLGVLQRVGRGQFIIGETKKYLPYLDKSIKLIYKKIKNKFPYLDLCIWHTSIFNEFMLHIQGRFAIILEVEKEAQDAVFYFLRDLKFHVFIDPSKEVLENYIPYETNPIIIKTLITEAPIQIIDNISAPTLEKILVDIYCDKEIFMSQQGAELKTIFETAIDKYTVNKDKMLRYASRRGKQKLFQEYLNSITKNWQ
jgi:hypothetical protein